MGGSSVGGEAPHSHAHLGQAIPLESPIPLTPVTVRIVPGDTVESIKDKAAGKTATTADSPDLSQAQWLLWWAASSNQYTLQSVPANTDSSIQSVSSINPGLAVLKEENAMMAIGVKALNAWGESLQKEAKEVRRELNSVQHQERQAESGKAGFEAYIQTLTPDQRDQAIHHSRLEKLANIDEGLAQGLGDYVNQIKTENSGDHNLAFMLGTLSVGAPTRFDAVSGPQVVAGAQTLINPIGGVADHVLPQVMPSYSVEMGSLATMFGVGTVYFTMGQTVAGGVVPTDPSFTNKFAQNYAQQVLKTINGSEFNTLALAMVTVSAAKGEPLSKKRQTELINAVKAVMLSSALILLYKTESSFKGQGGGISEVEFADLVNGKMNREDMASYLGGKINALFGTMPKEEANVLFAGLQSYVATNPKTSSLVDLDAVFAGVGKQIAAPEVLG